MNEPEPELPPRQPSSLRYKLGMGAAILVAVAALVLGVAATRTDDQAPSQRSGEVVEHFFPRQGSEVLRQVEIGIDLIGGYEAALSLNGIPIPTEELRIVPEQNQVFYLPAEGRTFSTLPSGDNCATATAWKSSEGRGANDLTFTWCFDVT